MGVKIILFGKLAEIAGGAVSVDNVTDTEPPAISASLQNKIIFTLIK